MSDEEVLEWHMTPVYAMQMFGSYSEAVPVDMVFICPHCKTVAKEQYDNCPICKKRLDPD
jgi:rubrerythrin